MTGASVYFADSSVAVESIESNPPSSSTIIIKSDISNYVEGEVNLENEKATNENQEPTPSTSGTIPQKEPRVMISENQSHIYRPGKIDHKKRKAPATQQPSLISAKKFRIIEIEKTIKKNSKRKNKCTENWYCIYCPDTFFEDQKSKKDKKWVECGTCGSEHMHIICIPKIHLLSIKLDVCDLDDDDVQYVCEKYHTQ